MLMSQKDLMLLSASKGLFLDIFILDIQMYHSVDQGQYVDLFTLTLKIEKKTRLKRTNCKKKKKLQLQKYFNPRGKKVVNSRTNIYTKTITNLYTTVLFHYRSTRTAGWQL